MFLVNLSFSLLLFVVVVDHWVNKINVLFTYHLYSPSRRQTAQPNYHVKHTHEWHKHQSYIYSLFSLSHFNCPITLPAFYLFRPTIIYTHPISDLDHEPEAPTLCRVLVVECPLGVDLANTTLSPHPEVLPAPPTALHHLDMIKWS